MLVKKIIFYEVTPKLWKLELISSEQGKLRGRYILNHCAFEENTEPNALYNSVSCAIVRLKRELLCFSMDWLVF